MLVQDISSRKIHENLRGKSLSKIKDSYHKIENGLEHNDSKSGNKLNLSVTLANTTNKASSRKSSVNRSYALPYLKEQLMYWRNSISLWNDSSRKSSKFTTEIASFDKISPTKRNIDNDFVVINNDDQSFHSNYDGNIAVIFMKILFVLITLRFEKIVICIFFDF